HTCPHTSHRADLSHQKRPPRSAIGCSERRAIAALSSPMASTARSASDEHLQRPSASSPSSRDLPMEWMVARAGGPLVRPLSAPGFGNVLRTPVNTRLVPNATFVDEEHP